MRFVTGWASARRGLRLSGAGLGCTQDAGDLGGIVTGKRRTAREIRRPGASLVLPIVIVGVAIALVAGWLALHNDIGSPATADGGFCNAAQVARNVLPSIVTVQTSTPDGGGNGSGQIVRPDGYVLPNYHDVSSAAEAGDSGCDTVSSRD